LQNAVGLREKECLIENHSSLKVVGGSIRTIIFLRQGGLKNDVLIEVEKYQAGGGSFGEIPSTVSQR
jgi:hypothetical protein